MSTIIIDDIAYDLTALSEAAKQQLTNVQAADAEIQRLQAQLAIATTARAAYARALKNALPAAVSH
ncbi:DUF6447 family protein [Paraburkholderia unamae]|uniref:Uncharacterized protein n=1 Tax=Paraburkholderia unamae TaxID=219649 RepID=A0ABX5KMI4_9BURK|nr:DUF6447 family protein [Paraburkholderia unamae]PVX82149.1 hypothetical protein C7402_1092 [Paraburkholderia unamae]RAR60479.1 hypothetical protein C7401_1092 [Paraburkholderia unamae]